MEAYFENDWLTLYQGDVRSVCASLDPESARCILGSPPYWGLKDYGVAGQLGLEATPQAYVAEMVECYAELRHLLRRDGTCWINIGDSYVTNPGNGRGGEKVDGGKVERSAMNKLACGLPAKNLVGVPWRLALALQDDNWILRSDVIWEKPNSKPDGVRDRPTPSHEYVFLLSKKARYYYDADAIAEETTGPTGKRNRRTVWSIPTEPFPGGHFACWPRALADRIIRASTAPGDTVIDPFFGAGTTALAARELGRRTIGIELNPDYCEIALKRLGCRPSDTSR